VGPWRVVEWAGHGAHSTVYRAVQVDKEHAAPVALKLALLPGAPRFAREVELLSRLRHPSIPRLWDSGEWRHPSGSLYPFIVMDWLEGVPLYGQAEHTPPSSQEALRLLAQLASALQALHAQGSVHRDVKGANILVRRSDGRAMLIDFGSGHYPDAATLTAPDTFPGTPAYRSPESGVFELQSLRDRLARYRAGPADDLYALGVTACRLLTGEYPQLGEPTQDEQGDWHLDTAHVPVALSEGSGVDPQLRAWVLRLLSAHPEARGTAAQLATELEQAAQPLVPENAPVRAAPTRITPESVPAPSAPEPVRSRVLPRLWILGVATASLGFALGLWARGLPSLSLGSHSIAMGNVSAPKQPDAGTTGIGETAASVNPLKHAEPASRESVTEDAPPTPLPEQTRPDQKGYCSGRRQIALNGGCWIPITLDREACSELNGHMYKGSCYMPVMSSEHSPTPTPMSEP
jgi:serine/threonine protein kinase